MSSGTQPGKASNIPDYEPMTLTPDHIAALSDKLNDWLTEISADNLLPEMVFLNKGSAYAVQTAINDFLDKIKTKVSLLEAEIHHQTT